MFENVLAIIDEFLDLDPQEIRKENSDVLAGLKLLLAYAAGEQNSKHNLESWVDEKLD